MLANVDITLDRRRRRRSSVISTLAQCYIGNVPYFYIRRSEWRAEARNGVRTATDDQFIEERAREHRTLHVPGPYTMVKLVSKGRTQYFTRYHPSISN